MRPMFNSEKAKMSPLNKKNKNLNERYKGSKNEVVPYAIPSRVPCQILAY